MANYLNKADMLVEIHASKKSYCTYLDRDLHSAYHAIVRDEAEITPELVGEIIATKAALKPKHRIILTPDQVVIRVMTHSHIPLDPTRKRKPRNMDKPYARTNFPAFKHFQLIDGQLKEVGRSHWRGTIEDGEFSIDHGVITPRLATMFMLLVQRISTKPNYRNYSYLEDMQGHALANLCHQGLMFDESKSDNPFAFYTTAVNHSFTRILNLERRVRDIRDELLLKNGALPSAGRQMREFERSMR